MFFTSTSRGLRMWFHVVGGDGLPRTNLSAGDFSATIINSTDTAVYTPTVTQSTQLAGMYRFDVPAAFLTGSSGGVGDYAVSVIVDTFNGPSSGTNVRTTFSRVINVSLELFDSLSGSIWNATSGTFNTGGSFGRALNLAQISSSVTLTQANIDSFVTGVWTAANGTFNTSGTMGWLENRLAGISSSVATNLDVAISTRAVPGDQMTLTIGTRGLIVSGVWDERVNLHTTSGSAGDTLYSASNIASAPSIDAITSGVWNALSGTFNTSGTMGRALNLAQVSATLSLTQTNIDSFVTGVWNAANGTFNTSGTMGWLENRLAGISSSVATNLDVAVSTRAVAGDAMTLTLATRGLIISGVWDERVNLHTVSGSTGDTLYSASNIAVAAVDVPSIVSGVWNATSGTFNTAGTFGRSLNLAQISASLTSDQIVSGVWNAANGTFNTSGTMGWLENRLAGISLSVATNLDVVVSTRAAAGDAMALTVATRGLIISGVWDERVNLHTVSGSAGDTLYSASNIATATSIDAITSGVWNAASGTFNTGGTTGRALILAQVSSSLSLSQAGQDAVVSGVWNAANSAFNTTGTLGWLENRIAGISSSIATNLDVAVSTRAVPGDAMSLTLATRGLIVSGVWDERINLHTTSGSAGDTLYSASNIVSASPTVDAITSGVWNATSGTFNISGTMGRALNLAQVSATLTLTQTNIDSFVSGVWNATNNTFNTSGTMGWLENRLAGISSSIVTNLDVPISTRAVPGDQMTLTLTTRGLIVSGVWDERVNLHTVSGSAGDTLYSASNIAIQTSLSTDTIVSGVWNAASGTFNAAGTMGRSLNLAQISSSVATVDVAAIVSGVWNAANDTFNTTGTMGWLENRISHISSSVTVNLDTPVSTRAVSGDQMSLTLGARALIVSGVWDERVNLHTTSGSAGDTLYSASNFVLVTTSPTVDAITSGVWSAASGTFNNGGTMGRASNLAQISASLTSDQIISGVWGAANGTFNTTGTMGWLENRIAGISSSIATNLDVAVSTRAVPGDQMTLTLATRGLIISGVWDERVNLHTTSGSAGDTLYSASNIISAATVDVPSIVSGVWNATSGTFNASGTMGRVLNLAQVSASLTLSQAGQDAVVSGVWNATNSTFNTSGTMGWLENRLAGISSSVATNLDVAVSTRAAAGDAMSLTVTTRGLIVSGVWDERVNLHTTSGSAGDTLYSASNIASAVSVDVSSIVSGVWNATSGTFNTAGTIGRGLNLAQVSSSLTSDQIISGVWSSANGTFNTSGTMGWLENRLASISSSIAANLDVAVSTRTVPGDQMTLTIGTRGLIVSGVWDERVNLHTVSGSAGDTLYSASNIVGATTVDVSSIVSGVWNATNSTFNTSGTMGWLENRIAGISSSVATNLDTTVSSRAIPGDAMSLTLLTRGLIISGVWDERVNLHTTSGSAGDTLYSASNISAASVDVSSIVSGVWNATSGTFNVAGTFGRALGLAQMSSSLTSDQVVSGVWNSSNSTFNTSGTMGWLENRISHISSSVTINLDTPVSTRAVPGDQMSLTIGTRALIVSGVWDERVNLHTTSGSAGDTLYSASNFALVTTSPTVDAITSGVWNATSGTFNVGNTLGRALNLAQVSSSLTPDQVVSGVWNATNSTFNTSGTMGWLENRIAGISSSISTNLDVAVSTRAASGDQMSLTIGTRALIISGVWDERINLHTVSGSAGDTLYSASNIAGAVSVDVPSIVSGVWNATSGTFNTNETMGHALNLSQTSSSVVLTQVNIDSIVSGVWNSSNSTFNTSGTMGWLENRIAGISSSVAANLDAAVSTRAVSGDQMSLTIGTRGLIVSGVWDERVNLHTTSGSAGDTLYSASNIIIAAATVDVDAVVSGVWNAVSSTFNTVGTMGRLLNVASAGGVDYDLLVSGVWNATGFNTSGTMGWLQNKSSRISSSVEDVRNVEFGRWLISGSQHIFYDTSGNIIRTFNLFTSGGIPFYHDDDAVVERVPTN